MSLNGIDLVQRERPHEGGHIERAIGTKMSKPKALTPLAPRDLVHIRSTGDLLSVRSQHQ